MTDAIALNGVAVERNGATVFSHGTFAIPRGSIVGVIGPNGSGKTTLLELLVGLLRPSEGTLEVLGETPSRGNPKVGYVPQNYTAAVADAVRCRDLVDLALSGTGWGLKRPRGTLGGRTDAALAAVGAAELGSRRLSEVSGGQQQRVAIAAGLVSEPELLLLDEPLANLDIGSARDIVTLLGEVTDDGDMTVLVVAHDLNALLPILTGAIYLLDGHAHYDTIDNVVDEDLLSHLYGTEMGVVRTPQGDLFTRKD
ncbi:MAG: ATP-binding cassette domain-containing protein [Microthrixaceae bacterium]